VFREVGVLLGHNFQEEVLIGGNESPSSGTWKRSNFISRGASLSSDLDKDKELPVIGRCYPQNVVSTVKTETTGQIPLVQ
jgi:hypothetical protein